MQTTLAALILAALILVVGLALTARLQTASAHQVASGSFLSPAAILRQATTPQVPAGVGTNVVPPAVSTAATAPPVVNTAVAAIAGSGQGSPTGGFPWPILALVVVGALVGVGVVAVMRRPKAPVLAASQAVQSAGVPAPRAPAEPYTPAAEQVAAPIIAAAPVVAAPVAPAMPATIECPNCGVVNNIDENFCKDCGQDLRLRRAQLTSAAPAAAAAAVTPPAPVAAAPDIDDTPYLETIDRADEQLEFVLSRPRVAMGTAPDNDIVIDSAYRGWETVSEHHAELQREQDGFMILDRDSENGTFVNEMRTGENIISDGDNLRLGDVRFIFRVPSTE